MKTANKSFYALEMSVDPGGARMWDVHVQDDLEEIRPILDGALTTSNFLYLLAWYGTRIELLTFHAGKEVQRVNLLPHIRVRVEGYPEIWFDANGERHGVKFKDQNHRRDYAELPDPEIEYKPFMEAVDANKFTAVMDWNAVSILPLQGERAQMGDRLMVDDERVGFGMNDLESGIYEDESISEDDEDEDDEEDKEEE